MYRRQSSGLPRRAVCPFPLSCRNVKLQIVFARQGSGLAEALTNAQPGLRAGIVFLWVELVVSAQELPELEQPQDEDRENAVPVLRFRFSLTSRPTREVITYQVRRLTAAAFAALAAFSALMRRPFSSRSASWRALAPMSQRRRRLELSETCRFRQALQNLAILPPENSAPQSWQRLVSMVASSGIRL